MCSAALRRRQQQKVWFALVTTYRVQTGQRTAVNSGVLGLNSRKAAYFRLSSAAQKVPAFCFLRCIQTIVASNQWGKLTGEKLPRPLSNNKLDAGRRGLKVGQLRQDVPVLQHVGRSQTWSGGESPIVFVDIYFPQFLMSITTVLYSIVHISLWKLSTAFLWKSPLYYAGEPNHAISIQGDHPQQGFVAFLN